MRRKSQLTTIGAALIALAVALVGCAEKIPLPEEMVGTWSTHNERYSARQLGFTPDQVVLGVGDGESHRHVIEAVYRKQQDGKTLYTVAYRTSYGKDRLVVYRKGDGIVLKNQPGVVWLKGERRR
jgi:hypothetical protein